MKIKINAPFSLAKIFGRGDSQDVKSLDFQPTDVILEGKLPIALPYDQTSLEMVIHIDRVRQGKNGHVNKVIQLTLEFTHEGITYSVEHRCGFDEIFPFLELTPRFGGFSYTFQKHSSHDSLLDYQQFVREQIQNHQRYGIHLPFPPGKTLSIWMGLVWMGVLLFCFIHFLLPTAKANDTAFILWLFIGLIALIALMGVSNLYRYYQAKSKLEQMKNNH